MAQETINTTEARLAEMNKIKNDNAKILKDIDAATSALRIKRGEFETLIQEQTQKLNTLKNKVALEAENHQASAENVAILQEIHNQRDILAKEIEGHQDELAAVQAEILKAKDELAAVQAEKEKQV